jgi:hypothetical protein
MLNGGCGGGRGGNEFCGNLRRGKCMGACNHCEKGQNKRGYWELDANTEKRPNGYHAHEEQANLLLDDDDDNDDIYFIMCGQCVPHKDVQIELKEQIHDASVLTDEYADVIVSEKAKYDFLNVGGSAVIGMEFPDSMCLLSDTNILIGDTDSSVHTPPCKQVMIPEMNYHRKWNK